LIILLIIISVNDEKIKKSSRLKNKKGIEK